jgi:hypothetical protein
VILQYLCNQKYTSLPPYSPTWNTVPSPPGQQPSSEAGPSSTVREVSATEPERSTWERATPTDPAQKDTMKDGERVTFEFERLVTGQEADTGEPPPSYKATTNHLLATHA